MRPNNPTLSRHSATRSFGRPQSHSDLVSIDSLDPQAWGNLADAAIDPNAFFCPAWASAVAAHAGRYTGESALVAYSGTSTQKLAGILPVAWASKALGLPLPLLVARGMYAQLSAPLLDRGAADEAARKLIEAAADAGAHGILLLSLPSKSLAAASFDRAARFTGVSPRTIRSSERALLDATPQPDNVVRSLLGAKKNKELRRQRNRLADMGEVAFSVASVPNTIVPALENFLRLEASGWKGRRGTALVHDSGDAEFIRRAIPTLASDGKAQIATLSINGDPIAAGILLRHLRRAYFFKIAYNETLAKFSPGVQLCLHITRYLCADPAIDDADSTAISHHPMIDHIWRDRLQVSDVLVPTRPGASSLSLYSGIIAARQMVRQSARKLVSGLTR